MTAVVPVSDNMATAAGLGDAAVLGVGLWLPAAADGDTWRRADARPSGTISAPPPPLAAGPARPRRRASLLAQMVAEVAAQAAAQARVSLATVPVVMGSAFGEMATTMDLLREREDGGDLSPTRFHNSVHNNAAGQLSIAHGNRDFTTSIAAGHETVAMVLLEALMLLEERGGHVLAIVADESLPTPLLHGQTLPAVAAALVLSAGSAVGSATALAWLGGLRQERHPDARPADAAHPVVDASPCAAVLPLLAAIALAARAARIDLTPGGACRWSIGFHPAFKHGAA